MCFLINENKQATAVQQGGATHRKVVKVIWPIFQLFVGATPQARVVGVRENTGKHRNTNIRHAPGKKTLLFHSLLELELSFECFWPLFYHFSPGLWCRFNDPFKEPDTNHGKHIVNHLQDGWREDDTFY